MCLCVCRRCGCGPGDAECVCVSVDVVGVVRVMLGVPGVVPVDTVLVRTLTVNLLMEQTSLVSAASISHSFTCVVLV